MGYMYSKILTNVNEGVILYDEEKYKQAFDYFCATSDVDVSSQYMLGICYLHGDSTGLNYDRKVAVDWLVRAADNGCLHAIIQLSYMSNINETNDWAMNPFLEYLPKRLANKYVWNAHCKGTDAYDQGDFHNAVKYFKQAYEAGGDPDIIFEIGKCYFLGLGVTQNFEIAKSYFLDAANQGYDTAQCMLGQMYLRGCGVEKDLLQATKWFFQATQTAPHDFAEIELSKLRICDEIKEYYAKLKSKVVTQRNANNHNNETTKISSAGIVSLITSSILFVLTIICNIISPNADWGYLYFISIGFLILSFVGIIKNSYID